MRIANPIPGLVASLREATLPADQRARLLLDSDDPTVRAKAPRYLTEASGVFALDEHIKLLERDESAEVRSAAFKEIVRILMDPREIPLEDEKLRQILDHIRCKRHTALKALSDALSLEQDSTALIEMFQNTTTLAVGRKDYGENLIAPLLGRLRSIGTDDVAFPHLCNALIPMVDDALGEVGARNVDTILSVVQEVATKAGVDPANRLGIRTYEDMRPLILHMQSKRAEMGLPEKRWQLSPSVSADF